MNISINPSPRLPEPSPKNILKIATVELAKTAIKTTIPINMVFLVNGPLVRFKNPPVTLVKNPLFVNVSSNASMSSFVSINTVFVVTNEIVRI